MQDSKNLVAALAKKRLPIKVIYLSSYLPRKCGIATFTNDLITAMNQINPQAPAEVIAMTDKGQEYDYPWEVKYRINQHEEEDYNYAAQYINQSSADIVCLQHEFGLYGGPEGNFSTCLSAGAVPPRDLKKYEEDLHSRYYLLSLLDAINKPIVSTFHTILPEPDPHQSYMMRRIIERSEAVVAMSELSRQTLIDVYECPPEKAVVIYHGVPEYSFNQIDKYQRKLRIKNAKPMILVSGLLGPGKGLEYIIEAMPAIVSELPNARLFIVGQTHPVILRNEGEAYREKLVQLAKRFKVSRHIRFVNKYLDDSELRSYYQAADFFMTVYPNIEQSASGTLSRALSAGKICVSTPYQYAREVLADGAGILIGRRDIGGIAKAVIDTYKDPVKAKAIRKLAYERGRMRTWPNVALGYLELFRLVISENEDEVPEEDYMSLLFGGSQPGFITQEATK